MRLVLSQSTSPPNLYGVDFRSSAPNCCLAFLMDFCWATLFAHENIAAAVQSTLGLPSCQAS